MQNFPMLARFAFVFSILVLAALASAHAGEPEEQHTQTEQALGIPDPINVLIIAVIISGLSIFASLFFGKSFRANHKKIAFLSIAIPVALSTIYLAGATVWLNITSESGGPIHWHADYEIWVCGEKLELADPHGFDNKIGTPTVHEHNDNRIHIEGVLAKVENAKLSNYFRAVGGEFSETKISLSTNAGLKTFSNGDLCNVTPAKLYMFVNGAPNKEFGNHVIAPFSNVPPGDKIKIIFTEKPEAEINPNLGEVP